MQSPKIQKICVNVDKLRLLFEEYPYKKKQVQEALKIDRSIVSKILTNKRKVEGGELLTIATIFDMNPFDLALKK